MNSPTTDRYGVLHVNGQILLNAGPSPRGEHGRHRQLTCPWAWAASRRGIREVHTDPLVQGSLVHVGNAQLLARRQAVEQGVDPNQYMRPEDAIRYVAAKEDNALTAAQAEEAGLWGTYTERAISAVRAYDAEIRFASWKVVAVEHLIELWALGGLFVPPPMDAERRRALARSDRLEDQMEFLRLGAPYLYTARVDLIRRNAQGRIEVVDHKTTGRIDNAKQLGFDLSGQVIGITCWASIGYGASFGGTWINAIEIPREGTDRSGRPKAIRVKEWSVAAVQPAYDDFAQRIEDAERRMLALLDAGRPLNRWTRALAETGPCWDRYGPCGLRGPCMEGK
jgi:hypothetical protein